MNLQINIQNLNLRNFKTKRDIEGIGFAFYG